jgi:hypothetical protein
MAAVQEKSRAMHATFIANRMPLGRVLISACDKSLIRAPLACNVKWFKARLDACQASVQPMVHNQRTAQMLPVDATLHF